MSNHASTKGKIITHKYLILYSLGVLGQKSMHMHGKYTHSKNFLWLKNTTNSKKVEGDVIGTSRVWTQLIQSKYFDTNMSVCGKNVCHFK